MANQNERRGQRDDEHLFDPSPNDDLARELRESFLTSATSGEDAIEDIRNQYVSEEDGGPFIESSEAEELAEGTDESNPEEATREPFPMAGHAVTGADEDEP